MKGSKWTSYMANSQKEPQKTEYQKNLEALMKTMTREEFKVILAGLMSNFKGFKIIEPEHFAFWYEALKDIDYQVCQLGVIKLVRPCRFLPPLPT